MTCGVRLRSQRICICLQTSLQRPQSHLALATAQEMETGRPVVVSVETVPREDTIAAPPALAQSQHGVSGDPAEATEEIKGVYSIQTRRHNQMHQNQRSRRQRHPKPKCR